MKILLFTSLLFLSGSSFAQSLDQSRFAIHCRSVGVQKVTSQAEAYGVTLIEDVHACEVDARFYNPSKYIWYCAKAKDANGVESTVTSIVQFFWQKCI